MTKSTTSLTPARLLAIGIVIILLTSWSGHQLGKARGHARAKEITTDQNTSRSGTNRENPGPDARPSGKAVAVSPRTHGIEKQMLALYRDSIGIGALGLDPEILAETKRLLVKMSSAEIAGFLESQMVFDGRPGLIAMHFNVAALWAAQDPIAALAYLRNSPRIIDQQIATNCFRSWATEHPDEALAWFHEAIPSSVRPHDLGNIFANVIGDLVKQDPELAMRELSKLPPDAMAQSLDVSSWVLGGDLNYQDRILSLARTCGKPELLVKIQNNIVSKISENDPAAALSFIDSLQASETERLNLDASVVVGQIHKAPEAALDAWLERNTTLTEIPAVLQSAVGTWLYSKKDEAIAWLDQLPAGEQRDGIFNSSVSSLTSHRNFSDAAELSGAIESAELREKALQTVNRQWSIEKPDEAAAWKAGLTADDRAILEK